MTVTRDEGPPHGRSCQLQPITLSVDAGASITSCSPEMFPESVQDADVIKVGSIWIPGS